LFATYCLQFTAKNRTFAKNLVIMALVYLGLGTNLGDKEFNLNEAITALIMEVGEVFGQSSLYKSKSWGFESANDFLNEVVLMKTNLSPFELLSVTQNIEHNLGRTAKSTNGYTDRIIDIDILLYDNLIIDQPTLKIPHPLIADRDFVIIPLAEIALDLVHPVLGIKMKDIIRIKKMGTK
jgi:2-amino-4-hydroxy-6-hydroxymethyldihydropteridine diphosphokinase